jgi:hypothetical protein
VTTWQTIADAPPAVDMVDVEFTVPAAMGACYADLVPEFTSWVPLPMDRLADGRFTITVRLATGQSWRYRFLIDGDRWANDWDALDYAVDDEGCGMSLVRT